MSYISTNKLKVIVVGYQPLFGALVGRARKEGVVVECHERRHKVLVRIVQRDGRSRFEQLSRSHRVVCCICVVSLSLVGVVVEKKKKGTEERERRKMKKGVQTTFITCQIRQIRQLVNNPGYLRVSK